MKEIVGFANANKLIQLQLDGRGVPVLRILNLEAHQEGYDRCAGVDHELPCVRKIEEWTTDRPHHDSSEGQGKDPGAPNFAGRLRNFTEQCLAVAPLHHGASRCTMEHNDATGVTTPRQTVKASPHRHKWMLSHGAPADPSDPWNSHAAPVSPRQNGQRESSASKAS